MLWRKNVAIRGWVLEGAKGVLSSARAYQVTLNYSGKTFASLSPLGPTPRISLIQVKLISFVFCSLGVYSGGRWSLIKFTRGV